ncbi:MAG: multidrug effflux MFS transporter [Pseudomonadota bacterium]
MSTAAPTIRFLDQSTPPHILTLVIIAGLSAATMNIYLPSLPQMATHFDSEYRTMQLSVSLYLATNAVLQLFLGPLSDRYGRRTVMLTACGLFCIATIGTLIAPTVEVFLLCRMAQAVIVAGLVLGRAVVRDIVADAQAASMIGYVTMGMALVPMAAPMVGGLLQGTFGWQASFWLLLILGLATMALVWRDMGETAPMSGGDIAKQFREAPELFTSRRFWGYCLTMTFCSGAFFAYLGGGPFVGEVVFGLDPVILGFVLGAPAVGYAAGNWVSGHFSVRLGINRMVVLGCVIAAAGMALPLALFYAGHESILVFFGSMVFVGLGNGITLPNATAGMLSVRPRLAGTASGLGGAMMIGGGAALSALAGALLDESTGALPLLWVMWLSSIAGLLCIAYVLRRERTLALGG